MQKIILALVFVFFTFHSQAQTFVFKMMLFGDSAGLSTITKTHEADGTDQYTIDSHIKAKILWITRENTTHYESHYRDGRFISSIFYQINNGKKDKWSNVTYDGKAYHVDTYHSQKTVTEVPTFSVGSMYCDKFDPSRKRFFYEPEGEYVELSFPESNTIEFKSPDGEKNVFHYKNGQIMDAEFHTTLATVYLKRIK